MLTIYVLVIFSMVNGEWQAQARYPRMTQEQCDIEKRRINTLGIQKAECYPMGDPI
jgi:hypothetical protein